MVQNPHRDGPFIGTKLLFLSSLMTRGAAVSIPCDNIVVTIYCTDTFVTVMNGVASEHPTGVQWYTHHVSPRIAELAPPNQSVHIDHCGTANTAPSSSRPSTPENIIS
jgi:hypothetical protein